MTRRLPALLAVAGALALAAPAAAQAPTPEPAAIHISVDSGIYDRGTRWVLTGEKLLVLGHIDPYVKGERVEIRVFRKGTADPVDTHSVKVEDAGDGTGKFQHRFDIKREAVYSVVAHHELTAAQEAGDSNLVKFRAIPAHVTGEKSTRLLQIGLRGLAFVTPLSGKLDEGTRRAVLAWRKVNGYHRNGSPNSTVFRRVFRGEGGFDLKHKSPSKHVEGDLSRQVLVLADKGRPVQIYTMSSGKPSTPTVRGTFKFYRRQPGTNSHGMVWSTYFYAGYAIHGYPSVPATYPASHGCLRVPIPVSYRIYKSIDIGETIYVYK